MIREPGLQVRAPDAGVPVRAVVLVLGGGRANSHAPARRRHLAYQRMRPFATTTHRATRGYGVAVWQLRYRVRGWNAPDRDPVRDARWALGRVRQEHGDVPVILIGHSMGGRASLAVAGDRSVIAVCALAPWVEGGDPVEQVAGRLLVIAHGDRDQMTDPAASRGLAVTAAALGARVAQFEVIGDAHAMLRRAADWHALARDTVLVALGIASTGGQLATVMGLPANQRLRVPLGADDSGPGDVSVTTG